MSKIFVTSDTHFGHSKIIQYCNRPFKDVAGMDKVLMDNWNNTVAPEDIVYHLGDFVFKRGLTVPIKVNGHIILIRGNHDKGVSATQLKTVYGVNEIHKNPIVIKHNGIEIALMHRPNQLQKDRINLCGHVHTIWEYKDGFYNVSTDIHNFRPVLLDSVLDRINKICYNA